MDTTYSPQGGPQQHIPTGRLWLNWLASPLIWALHFVAVYAPAEFLCRANLKAGASFDPALVQWWTIIAGVVALSLMAWAGVRSFTNWRRTETVDAPAGPVDDPAAYSSFMSLVGLGFSVVFGLAVLLETLPVFFLYTCEVTNAF